MDCPIRSKENREWLLDYAAGRLDRQHAGMVEQHMEGCTDCVRFVAEQRVVWDALGQWEPKEISADFNRRLYQKIEQAKPASWLQLFWRPLMPVVAACLLIVAGVALHTPAAKPIANGPQANVESVEPEQVERTLDDLQMLRELALTPQEAKTSQPM